MTLDYSEPKLAMKVLSALGDQSNTAINIVLNTIYHIYEPLLQYIEQPRPMSSVRINLPGFTKQHQSPQNKNRDNIPFVAKKGAPALIKPGVNSFSNNSSAKNDTFGTHGEKQNKSAFNAPPLVNNNNTPNPNQPAAN